MLGLGAVLLVLVDHNEADVGRLSALGRQMRGLFSAGQLMLVGILAPLQAAMAVEEERADRSLDLLVLTPLTRGQLLWGKVASRLVHLFTVVLAGLPVLGLIATFGGVSPWHVVNLTVNSMLLGVLLAQAATVLLIAQRGSPLLAAAGAWVWAGGLQFVGLSGALWDEEAIPSPVLGAFMDGAGGLSSVPVLLPVVAVLGWLGPLLFQLSTGESEDDELGLLSPDVWALHRYRRRVLWLLPLASILGLMLFWGMMELRYSEHHPVLSPLPVLWVWSAALVGITVLEVGSGHLLMLAARARRAVVQRRSAREESRSVGRWPLVWRLFRTRVAAAVRPLVLGTMGLWGAGTLFSLLTMRSSNQERLLLPALAAWTFGIGLAGVLPLATTIVDSDVRRRQLLVLAGCKPWSVVSSHMAHALARALPLHGLGALCFAWLATTQQGPASDEGSFVVAIIALAVSTSAVLASQSTVVGLLAPRRVVWLVGIGGGLALLFTPTVLAETFDVFRGRDDNLAVELLRLWNPLAASYGGQEPLWMVWRAVGAHLIASAAALGAASWHIGRQHR